MKLIWTFVKYIDSFAKSLLNKEFEFTHSLWLSVTYVKSYAFKSKVDNSVYTKWLLLLYFRPYLSKNEYWCTRNKFGVFWFLDIFAKLYPRLICVFFFQWTILYKYDIYFAFQMRVIFFIQSIYCFVYFRPK